MAIINHGRLISCGTMKALQTQAAVDGSLEEVFLTLTREAEQEAVAPDQRIQPAAEGDR